MAKAYQLVIQLPESALLGFDKLIELEDVLIDTLGCDHDLDGHDIGGGTINMFVETPKPVEAWRLARPILESHHLLDKSRAAYREIESDAFKTIWPEGNKEQFSILCGL